MSLRARTGAFFLCLLALAGDACAREAEVPASVAGTIESAFTPGEDVAALVVRTIDEARSQVLVQAFSFTHRDIADALIRAQRRGVDVQIIADNEQTVSSGSAAMRSLIDAGVPVFTDAEHAAAHNKVVIVDCDSTMPALITGSFNFTFAAQNRNAENVLVLHGFREVAQAYRANWQTHRQHASAIIRTAPR